jgi:hypothetical protein
VRPLTHITCINCHFLQKHTGIFHSGPRSNDPYWRNRQAPLAASVGSVVALSYSRRQIVCAGTAQTGRRLWPVRDEPLARISWRARTHAKIRAWGLNHCRSESRYIIRGLFRHFLASRKKQGQECSELSCPVARRIFRNPTVSEVAISCRVSQRWNNSQNHGTSDLRILFLVAGTIRLAGREQAGEHEIVDEARHGSCPRVQTMARSNWFKPGRHPALDQVKSRHVAAPVQPFSPF